MDRPPDPPRHFLLLAAAFEGSLVLVAMVLGWLLSLRPADEILWTWSGAAWGALASLPLLALLWLGIRWPLPALRKVLQVIDELLVPLFRSCSLLDMAIIALLAGLGEEMLFRGVLQQAVADWVGGNIGVWVGLVTASVLFGLAHSITRLYVVLATLIGLYLGGLWLFSDNLLVPITTHAVYDFLALVYFVRIRHP